MRTLTLAALAAGLAYLGAAADARAFEEASLVREKCASCHVPTADGRLAQIEDLRTSPEEWAVIVDRMRRLHDVKLGTGDVDRLVKELTSTQGLSADEQSAVAYLSLWNNAQTVETPGDADEEKAHAACVRCHSAGKIHSYRRTEASWRKLRDFHLWVVPTVVFQLREMRWVPEADAALAWYARKLPYGQPGPAPQAKLDGRWGVFGYAPGRGAYRGEARITPSGDGEFKLDGSVLHADGMRESFTGEATLYGGVALRTRTRNDGFDTRGAFVLRGDALSGEWHHPAPEFRTSRLRWIRDDGAPKVARILPSFVLSGEKTTLTVEGVNLPQAGTADVDFGGAPVRVLSVRRRSPASIELAVTSGAASLRDAKVTIAGIDAGSVKLAPRIDGIEVTPSTGRARLSGGAHHPAEGVQYEAIAYARTGSGKSAARVPLGPVPAAFKLAELKTRPGDDDMKWVGDIRANGEYTPVGDYGVNPARGYRGDNTALVKVLATYRRGARAYTGQAELMVTVPDYIARIR